MEQGPGGAGEMQRAREAVWLEHRRAAAAAATRCPRLAAGEDDMLLDFQQFPRRLERPGTGSTRGPMGGGYYTEKEVRERDTGQAATERVAGYA